MEKNGTLQLANAFEKELIEQFLEAGILETNKIQIKNGKLQSIELNDQILQFILEMPYSDINVKRLLHLKSIKSIALDYRYSFALSKFFLKNNDIVSAEIQFKAAHNLIDNKAQLQDFAKILGIVYSLFTKKYQKTVSDFENYKIKGLIQTKYPIYFSQLLEIIEENEINEELLKKKKIKLIELFVKLLLSL